MQWGQTDPQHFGEKQLPATQKKNQVLQLIETKEIHNWEITLIYNYFSFQVANDIAETKENIDNLVHETASR